ncbi:MAG TPA: hypothetical protein VJL31_12305, partial [Gemmatimonadales bacterium]|nr:hypothetical protein [Gemmatimonadales bacterium]
STTLGITNIYDPRDSVVLPNYPSQVLATVTVVGLTSVYWNWPPENQGQLETTLDARGRFRYGVWNNCYEDVKIWFSVTGLMSYGPCSGYTSEETLTKLALLQGQGKAWWGGRYPQGVGDCDNGPCRYYEGLKEITIEPVEAEFTVTAEPATVNYKDSVTITAAVSPYQVDGVGLPWKIDSLKWVPAFGTQSSPCPHQGYFVPTTGASPTRTCRKPFTRSGTMTLFATVNGVPVQEAVAITVTPPELTVTATPASIAGPDSVTFTASVTPSNITWNLSGSGWTWRPDSGTGGLSYFCPWYEKTCRRVCSKSGWMKATATIGEYALVDSAHVSVVPCLTNDSILDDSRIRRKLKEAWEASNPNSAADQRRERFGMRVRLPGDQIVDTNFVNLPGASPCRAYDPEQFDPRSIGEILLIWHTHPFKPAHLRPDSTWGADAGELLPYGPEHALCPQEPGRAAFPGPSGLRTGEGDVNQPWPQIIIDKTNSYWIEQPATNPAEVFTLDWLPVVHQQCDIRSYF